jgi:hypothetical protein
MGREDEIRLIAYRIWEEEQCVHGHDCEHWFRAEAIWERQQKEKASAKSIKTGSKRTFGRHGKTTIAKKK